MCISCRYILVHAIVGSNQTDFYKLLDLFDYKILSPKSSFIKYNIISKTMPPRNNENLHFLTCFQYQNGGKTEIRNLLTNEIQIILIINNIYIASTSASSSSSLPTSSSLSFISFFLLQH